MQVSVPRSSAMSYIRRLRGASGVVFSSGVVVKREKSCVCYPIHYVIKSGCLNARQLAEPAVVDRVGMRLGLEAGYPVMGGVSAVVYEL